MILPISRPMLEVNTGGVLHMDASSSQLTESQTRAVQYCDRCARRSGVLFYDDLTRKELCRECCDRLNRKRTIASSPVKLKM